MRKLSISGVRELTFGRHAGRDFDGFHSPFVVVHGPNESGKSTLAEFLVWAIGGPWRSFAENSDAFRRGTDKVLQGRLRGLLDGEEIEVNARFELLMKGVPKDLRRAVIGVNTVDTAKLAERLGGLTAADYQLMYRVYGATLGDIGSASAFSDLFSRFALGTTSAVANPRQSLEAIRKDAAALQKIIATLRGKLKEKEGEIRKASDNPEKLSQSAAKIEDLDLKISELLDVERDNNISKTMMERARAGFPHLDECRLAEDQLEAMPSLSAEWIQVVDNLDAIRSLAEKIVVTMDDVDSTSRMAIQSSAASGVDIENLRRSTLTPPERLDLSVAAHNVINARKAKVEAEGALGVVLDEEREAVDSATQSREVLGLSEMHCQHLDAMSSTLPSLENRAARWSEEHNKVVEVEAELSVAQQNSNQPHAPGLKSGVGIGANRRVVSLLVLAVGAAWLVHPFVGIVAGVALAALVYFSGSSRHVPHQGDESFNLADLDRRLRLAKETAASHKKQLDDALGVLSSIVNSPDTAQACLQQLSMCAAQRKSVVELAIRVQKARDRVNLSVPQIGEAEAVAESLMVSRGIPFSVLNDAFDQWLVTYEQAVAAVAQNVAGSNRLADLREKFDRLIQPVAQELSGFTPQAIVSRIESESTKVHQRRELEKRFAEAQMKVRAAGMDSEDVRDVLACHPTPAELAIQIDLHTSVATKAREERDDLITQRESLRSEFTNLSGTEVIPQLAIERGMIEEQLEELAHRHAALELAAKVLGDVIDSYERDNQDPVVAAASELVGQVAPEWGTIIMTRDEKDIPVIMRDGLGGRLSENAISDGGRALLYLGIRLAFAKRDADQRGIALPIICDDPLVHFDDDRRRAAIQLLAHVSTDHQVVLFTCERDTRDFAESLGASVVEM